MKTWEVTAAGDEKRTRPGRSFAPIFGPQSKRVAEDPQNKSRRPVSRVLFPLAGSAVIPLRRVLPRAWCDTPGVQAKDGPCAPPIRSCSRRGLPCGPRHRSPGGLLPHPFTLTPEHVGGGLLSVALSLDLRRVDVIHRLVSVEPGLSSSKQACQRLPSRLERRI